jgi:toxin ParE1/3/4
MVEIRWTFQSVEDLESITNYISKDSSYFAKLIISNIIDVVDQLVFYPELGRVVPEKISLKFVKLSLGIIE